MVCYTNYGLLLYRTGRREEAEKMYELCLEISPEDGTCLNNYSILLMETGKFDKAEEISRKCLKLDPTNENCLMNLGKIALARQNSLFADHSDISEII